MIPMRFSTILLFSVIVSHVTAGDSVLPDYYNNLEQYLLSRMNFSVDPCDDFHTYACGNSDNYYTTMIHENQRIIKTSLAKFISSERDYPPTSAIGKTWRLYKPCVDKNATKAEVDAYVKMNVIRFLQYYDFPTDFFFDDNANVKIDRERFSGILQYVHDTFFIEPFFEMRGQESKLYKNEKERKGFAVFTFLKVKQTFELMRYRCNSPKLLEAFIEEVRNVNSAMGLAATDCKIEETARKLMEFELRLSGIPCGDNNITVTSILSVTQKIEEMKFETYGIDLDNYIRNLIATGKGSDNIDIQLAIDSLREVLESTSDADLLRYIYFRIVSENAVDIDCVDALKPMELVVSRIYTESKYASAAEREYFSDGMKFSDVIEIVKENMQNMVLSMPWLQADKHAYDILTKKFEYMRAEVAIEKDMLNDTWLDHYYEQLQFGENECFFVLASKAQRFAMYKKVRLTTYEPTDFELGLTGVEAQFAQHLNKLIINDGFLLAPHYHKNYDFSFNFGSIAGTAGHEISHSVDTRGINHDEKGFSNEFVNNVTADEFVKMITCVIDQFNKIQVLPSNYTPNHVNGVQTLSENMADISGTEAAFRAFETFKRNGKLSENPEFTHPKLRGLTHDQLFFLGLTNGFCYEESYNFIYYIIQADPHSPNPARALSLSNIPAFGKAFNCPVGSKYRPTEYCRVWT